MTSQSGNLKPSKKSIRQKQDRRKSSLMNKAYQYSKKCGADVYLGIRIRETGKVFTLQADTSGFWSFAESPLVCFLRIYYISHADTSRIPTTLHRVRRQGEILKLFSKVIAFRLEIGVIGRLSEKEISIVLCKKASTV